MSVWQRHAHYYLSLTQSCANDWQRIEAELDQIYQAWDWVSSPDGEMSLILGYVEAMAAFQQMRGLWKDGLSWHQRGLVAARMLGNCKEECTFLNNIGWYCHEAGEQRHAMNCYEQALIMAREASDRASEAVVLSNMALVHLALGEHHRAMDLNDQALSIRREVGDRAGEATTLDTIGRVYHASGEYIGALESYEQALVFGGMGVLGEVTVLNIWDGLLRYGRTSTARSSIWSNNSGLERIGDRPGSQSLCNLAVYAAWRAARALKLMCGHWRSIAK